MPDALPAACAASPTYSTVIMWLPDPTWAGLYSNEQPDSVPEANGLRTQVFDGPKLALGESERKETIPSGADVVPSAVSLTVTVHVADCGTTTPKPQLTDTVVPRRPTASMPDPLNLG
jgi:hypothetical protein